LSGLGSRHAIKHYQIKRYVRIAGFSDYSADMRNTNSSIDLWPIQFSDYSADVRKFNLRNDLRPTPFFWRGRASARTPPRQASTESTVIVMDFLDIRG
jgi:hypothetical protein